MRKTGVVLRDSARVGVGRADDDYVSGSCHASFFLTVLGRARRGILSRHLASLTTPVAPDRHPVRHRAAVRAEARAD